MNNRDNFTKKTKDILAKRVAYKCSNPTCKRLTIGPHTEISRTNSIGVAAHITAAAPNGPRYDSRISTEKRKHVSNAIWLCTSCSKLIDNDVILYSKKKLIEWKKDAEYQTLVELTNSNQDVDKTEIESNKNDFLFNEIIEEFFSPKVVIYNMTPSEYYCLFQTDNEYFKIETVNQKRNYIKHIIDNEKFEEISIFTNSEILNSIELDYGISIDKFIIEFARRWNLRQGKVCSNSISKEIAWEDLTAFESLLKSTSEIIYSAEEVDMLEIYPIAVVTMMMLIDEEYAYDLYCEYDFMPHNYIYKTNKSEIDYYVKKL